MLGQKNLHLYYHLCITRANSMVPIRGVDGDGAREGFDNDNDFRGVG
jgi:hypothetical protein